MNKLLSTVVITLIPVLLFATESSKLPDIKKGINYVSEENLYVPPAYRTNEFKVKMEKEQNELETLGYIETDVSSEVNTLLQTKKYGKDEIKECKGCKYGSLDTGLKANASDIKLSVSYKPISFIKDVIGFAAANTYFKPVHGFAPSDEFVKENGGKEGWTGIGEFFNDPDLGVCHYLYQKVMGIQASNKHLKYFINNHLSYKVIEGNQRNGFIYSPT